MAHQAYVSIPTTTADKLAVLGRALLDLAKEMQERATAIHEHPQTADAQRFRNVPADQRWFWSPQWQALEKEADEDIAAGRVSGPFHTVDDLIASLEA